MNPCSSGEVARGLWFCGTECICPPLDAVETLGLIRAQRQVYWRCGQNDKILALHSLAAIYNGRKFGLEKRQKPHYFPMQSSWWTLYLTPWCSENDSNAI